ncbi:protein of unknown function [Sanguibacter gelidistatuariae]|uniref:DUF4862 domain-containing protein n=1 Tax=Sanguibacter gelidistatuariae TaxID=1814289 RepID=A0A1G6V2N0_9MICO|nr:DUF4862 family protein [Sanguibacter gelidistatuariae]SDD47743.1 protein of unknown function [Sanguibacter gelidistatuariae]
MTSASLPSLTFGAYALTPGPLADDGRAEEEFYAGLGDLPIATIEFPLLGDGAPSLDPEWIARTLRPGWDLMVTCIPRTMMRLATAPGYGLASTDADGRRAALADVAVVRDLARALAEAGGRPRVTAIEVQSAPGPLLGSVEAFAESLAELATWDLGGAEIVVEHCDALVAGQAPVKGFLSIEDEIAAIQVVLASEPSARLGVGINWGRSAIEGRSGDTATEHVRLAAQAGLLRSIIFSGATDQVTAWGPAWADNHMAPRGTGPALAASSASLLGADEVRAALAAAGQAPIAFVGAKVTIRPDDATARERLALARAALSLLVEAGLDVGGTDDEVWIG